MKILILVLMALISYGCLLIFYPKFKKDILFILAIGAAVSANIYNIGNYPITVGKLVFGLDSILYTLFIFCVILCFLKFGKKSAMSLTLTSMASIFFTGIIQFLASWGTSGYESAIIWGFCSFIISVLATFIAVYVMLNLMEKLQNKLNQYINTAFGIFIASIINSIIYFGLIALIGQTLGDNFGYVLLSSYIGKGIALCFSIATLLLINYILKKKESLKQ